MKKCLLISIIVMLVCLAPMFASTADATIGTGDSPYDLSTGGHAAGDIITVTAGSTLTIIQSVASGNPNMSIVCQPNVNLTIHDLGIDSTGVGRPALDFTGGVNTLTISSSPSVGNGMNGDADRAGVRVPAGVSLIIQGKGHLSAMGWFGGAGIGGNEGETAGSITICLDAGGEILAYGSSDGTVFDDHRGAGIGGGRTGAGGTIVFCDTNAGRVEAYGGYRAAGVGGGASGAGGNITVLNGEIEATGGTQGAGIGGGRNSDSGNIVISGGEIEATGGRRASGIGGGRVGNVTSITIDGGDIVATGQIDGAGIGGGRRGVGNNINISGGKITATSGDRAAGIGGGFERAGFVSITGGRVYARTITSGNEQDIGSGRNGGASTVVLSGTADVFVEKQDTITTALPYQQLSSNPPGYNIPASWTYQIDFYGTIDVATNPQTGYSNSIGIIYLAGIIIILAVVGILLVARKKKIEKKSEK